MIILYVLLIAYIAAINFYAFLLVKSLKAEETQAADSTPAPQKSVGKLCITGALGGAITIYACMFLFKFRKSDLLLMVLMPVLGVLNIYIWVLLFRSGFGFYIVR